MMFTVMRTNCKVIICFISLTALLGCGRYPPKSEELILYNDILNAIIDKYYIYCLNGSDEQFLKQYADGLIDEFTFSAKIDSLKESRKNTQPKCVLDYSDEFDIFAANELKEVRHYIKLTIEANLNNTFIMEYFKDESVESVVDTLSKAARLNPENLIVPSIHVVPYVNGSHFGNGIGVVAISRAYFNRRFDKAILYYEFYCGLLCGKSQVMFVDKVNGHWKAINYLSVGDI